MKKYKKKIVCIFGMMCFQAVARNWVISRVQKSTFFLLMRGCIRAGARNWVISRVVGQGGDGETISCHNGASLPGKLQNS